MRLLMSLNEEAIVNEWQQVGYSGTYQEEYVDVVAIDGLHVS